MKTLHEYLTKIPSMGPNTGMKLVEIGKAINAILEEGVEDQEARVFLYEYRDALSKVSRYAFLHQAEVLKKFGSLLDEYIGKKEKKDG